MDPIKFHAYNPERNIDRIYEIHFGKTLFGQYAMFVAWGRRSHKARYKDYIFDTKAELEKFTSKIVRKRLNATKRLGVNYEKR